MNGWKALVILGMWAVIAIIVSLDNPISLIVIIIAFVIMVILCESDSKCKCSHECKMTKE